MTKRSNENLSLFGVNAKVWEIGGLVNAATQWKVVPSAVVAVLMSIGMLLNVYMTRGNLELIIFNFFLLSPMINGLVRFYVVLHNYVQFVEFFEILNKWYEQAEHVDGLDSLATINKVAAKARILTKYCYVLTATGVSCTCLYPIIIGGRKLVVDIYIPGVDVKQSPIYEIIYGLQVCLLVPFVVFTFVPFALFILISLLFGIAVLQDLQSKLNNLANASNEVMLREIKKCIQYHNRIIKYRNDLEALASLVCLVDNVLFVIMLCMMLFYVSVGESTTMMLTTIAIMTVPFSQITLIYWLANEFSHESTFVSQAAYNVNWVEGSKDLRRCVLLMITKSQNPLQLTSGGMQPLTMEVFQAILRISYSFFTLLQGLI